MSGQGISQIVVYAAALVALGYPLGIWMARVYTASQPAGRFFGALEDGFLRIVRADREREQDWKGYGKTVLVFSVLFFLVLYAIQRIQGHLFLNPDDMKDVPSHLSLNTAASFVTNTNWQFYGGEYTMSYLSQMAGLAVQNFVSAAVGVAVLSAVIRGLARRSSDTIGNFWRDLYRTLVYLLLPLCLVVSALLIWQGVPQTFHAHATATTLQGATQDIARGPVASQIAMKQLGTNGGGYYNSNSAVPFENPTGLSNFIEMLAILLIPAAEVFMFGRMVARATTCLGGVRGDVRRLRDRRRREPRRRAARLGRAAPIGGEHHAGQRLQRREHVRQGGPIRHRQHGDLDDRDERRLERLGQRRVRRDDACRRSCAPRQPLPRRGDLRRRRLRALRDVLLHRDRGVRRGPDGRANP